MGRRVRRGRRCCLLILGGMSVLSWALLVFREWRLEGMSCCEDTMVQDAPVGVEPWETERQD